MEAIDEYFECPQCGFMLTFRLKGDKYVSYCPYCQGRLEMSKEEYEKDDGNTFLFKADI